MPKWIQHPVTHKLIPAEQYRAPVTATTAVMGDIEPFLSPVDGKPISSRSKLREHQNVHDVRQHGEYGENNGAAYFERKQAERHQRINGATHEQRQERLNDIRRAVDKRT